MIEILLFFIGASLLLYVLLGGADYGAGILELLPIKPDLRTHQKNVINDAMGPVWEANHMWLILVVVILFMGFPLVFTTMMTALHIPMVALLVGIVIRGSVFTFRHYDAISDEKSQKIYTWLFGISSFWTSLWLGIIVGSLNRGRITLHPTDFYSAYIAPWWGLYPLMMGFFVVFIFGFLASIYLIGETRHVDLRILFARRAFSFNVLVVVFGALVFLTSYLEGGRLLAEFFAHKTAIVAMLAATLLYIVLWFFVEKRKIYQARVISAGQIFLIIVGAFLLHFPNALFTIEGPMSFYDAAAPAATLRQLVIALLVGSLFIFPSLFYLLKVFKINRS
ncbi:cytochrome d ubiquinol oxidase subunit II [Bdellovibrio sp. HCB2-146]|uniref:cytochrome d ubiquinol oxidase subunit II n=1 Tax=Bdellovibrio sp. HCB2-146 TaxID=3394362 RepID=UPI0039BD1FEB